LRTLRDGSPLKSGGFSPHRRQALSAGPFFICVRSQVRGHVLQALQRIFQRDHLRLREGLPHELLVEGDRAVVAPAPPPA